MKLYGTITSERASKGQGGKWLEIVVLDEQRKKLLDMRIEHDKNADNEAKIKTTLYTSHRNISAQFSDMYNAEPIDEFYKAKRQKGEHDYLACTWCGKSPTQGKYAKYCSNECKRQALGQMSK